MNYVCLHRIILPQSIDRTEMTALCICCGRRMDLGFSTCTEWVRQPWPTVSCVATIPDTDYLWIDGELEGTE